MGREQRKTPNSRRRCASPESRDGCARGGGARRRRAHRQYQQQGEGGDSGQLVQRRGEFQIFDDGMVGDERHENVQRRAPQGDPAERLVAAEREQNRRRTLPRPDRAGAQYEAGEGGGEPEEFR